MSRSITYYFSLHSPWTYLGNAVFHDIARRHGCAIDYRPMPLRSVFDETGGLPLPKRHPVRQRYRLVDLQRWRERRGLPLVLQPKHFPFDASQADRMAIAILEAGHDPSAFIGDVMAGVWARNEDMTRPEALLACADRAGLDGPMLLAATESPVVRLRYEDALGQAVEAGVFGAPSYVLDGEVFWGQDRLELLDSALASGRSPYRPEDAL
ncbi:disulfide bond formation protein DsbA [Bosea thiooxidans]|uniref:2-hydroxychromene-2-carboxylate isomerase n=1 Tax=Bosea thiooxidans TaxID=53254 RepID=A0A0Q3I8J3_9HYPH|nr:2-hydroxychromene-2-carboxylate isomerase [Bosea thiooxidans]KQK31336.1 disulfide bond formation protein DsbA [Bosea thiooxidans]SKB38229.1 2-hydroxychromene-2-carboxylate isomerase [Bosea thiooxidans]